MPSRQQELLLRRASLEYITLVNDVVDYALGQGIMPKLSSASVCAALPSAVRNQALQDARAVYKKCRKTGVQHILRKPVIHWNNQNYVVKGNHISLPLLVDGKSQRVTIKAMTTPDILEQLANQKLSTLRITQNNHKWVA